MLNRDLPTASEERRLTLPRNISRHFASSGIESGYPLPVVFPHEPYFSRRRSRSLAHLDSSGCDQYQTHAQVLATVISQAKLVVSEILEASPGNEYAHAVASLPSVQDLCFSVFAGGDPAAAAAGGAPLYNNPAAAGPRDISSPLPNAAVRSGDGVGDRGLPPQEPPCVGSAGGFGGSGAGIGGGDGREPLLDAAAARRPAR